MGRHGSHRRHEPAIVALLAGRSSEEAAREAGVSSRTLRRWMKNPGFRQCLHEARRESFARDMARLQQGSAAAVNTLLKTLLDQKTKESTRWNIAKFILASMQKTLEIEGLELRISSLEQKVTADPAQYRENLEEWNVDAEDEAAS